MCFMRDNFYLNVPIRMNFGRINNTLAYGDNGTPYATYGLNMESKSGESWDWVEPTRRIFSDGEIAEGCYDLDGSTVGKPGSFMINHMKKADFFEILWPLAPP